MKETKKSLDSLQVVCFGIGSEEYGIEVSKVQEILKLPKVTKLPKSADFIKGVINLRGKVIPIINLGKRFGITISGEDKSSRAIVVDIKGKRIGLAIDSVSHVIKIGSNDIEPPPPIVKGISGRYVIGIGKIKDGFIVILDVNKIFSSEELKVL